MLEPDGPPTERQLARLEWARKKLKRQLPKDLTKQQASDLISQWFDEDPELEDEWQDEKSRREDMAESEMEMATSLDDIDEWLEFYDCRKIPTARAKAILRNIGCRQDGESIDVFCDRFYSEARRVHPEYFAANPQRPPRLKRATESKEKFDAQGCLVIGICLIGICYLVKNWLSS